MNAISGSYWPVRLVGSLGLLLAVYMLLVAMHMPMDPRSLWGGDMLAMMTMTTTTTSTASQGAERDRDWHPPRPGLVNNLTAALDPATTGVYGFRFDGSAVEPDSDYGVYNWCNMPHVRPREYVVPDRRRFRLVYVELVHRHHKRTPYATNGFPRELYDWHCDDARLRLFAEPVGEEDGEDGEQGGPAAVHLLPHNTPSDNNPFIAAAPGWHGRCRFPQLTAGGLQDAWQHGADLYGVYHGLLGFLPAVDGPDAAAQWAAQTAFRVTNNEITSETVSMVLGGMWSVQRPASSAPSAASSPPIPLLVEPAGLDALEPQYACPAGQRLFSAMVSTADTASGKDAWPHHLRAAAAVFRQLDAVSGVDPARPLGFHASFDHYYDNLSARRCHAKPDVPGLSRALADVVFRLGQWEYSRMYRDDPRSLAASTALWGVWVGQLAAHLRLVQQQQQLHPDDVLPRYRHNVAHDGSISRLLSILQSDDMVWPGMGSEVVFEVWEDTGEPESHDQEASPALRVRVLFGGRVLRSSHPRLGLLDMLPLDALIAYFDSLVGRDASLVMGKCNGSIPL